MRGDYLTPGDLVLASHEATGTTGTYTVTATWQHLDPFITTLTIAGEDIETTPEHPFFVLLRGWVLAGDLRVGDSVRLRDGSYALVEATETAYDPQVMYNVTVAGAHTYFVGDDGCTVHNACPTDFGLSTIFDDPKLHRLWEDSLKNVGGPNKTNAYTKYLDMLEQGKTPSPTELSNAFGSVSKDFLERARKQGYTIAQVHHWNFDKKNFPNQLVDPRNLVPTPNRNVHSILHAATSGGTDRWKGPIDPRHLLLFDDTFYPLCR